MDAKRNLWICSAKNTPEFRCFLLSLDRGTCRLEDVSRAALEVYDAKNYLSSAKVRTEAGGTTYKRCNFYCM